MDLTGSYCMEKRYIRTRWYKDSRERDNCCFWFSAWEMCDSCYCLRRQSACITKTQSECNWRWVLHADPDDNSMHCGFRFALWSFESYILTPHSVCPILQTLYSNHTVQISSACSGCSAYVPESLLVPRCSSTGKSLCVYQPYACWFHWSCFPVLNARSACLDLIIASNTDVYPGRLATLFTSCECTAPLTTRNFQ